MTTALVIGAGALGSIYGAAMHEAGVDVTLLARPAHTDAISESGLRLRSSDGTERTAFPAATADPARLPESEIVLFTAKAFDVAGLVDAVPGEPRWVASVQNGVGKDDLLVSRFGAAVVGCTSMVGGTLVSPGVVHHTLDGTTYIGPLECTAAGGDTEMASTLTAGGLPVELRPDIGSVTWSKAVMAVATMGVVAVTRFRLHQALLNEHAAALLHALASEAATVAEAENAELVDIPGSIPVRSLVSVGPRQGVAQLQSIGRSLEAAGADEIRLSILQAIESRRRTEVEAVHGDVLARARRHGIDTPVLETITTQIRALDSDLDL